MMRYSIFIFFVLFCIYTEGQYLEDGIQEKKVNYVIQKDQNKITTSMTIVDKNRDYNKLSDFLSYKSTEPPNRPKATKKPGTYLQSIWDIYFP